VVERVRLYLAAFVSLALGAGALSGCLNPLPDDLPSSQNDTINAPEPSAPDRTEGTGGASPVVDGPSTGVAGGRATDAGAPSNSRQPDAGFSDAGAPDAGQTP
jgi:hypothetical protein